MPAVFALADKGIQDPQTATFAAFGSFAMLVLADFGGSLRAHMLLWPARARAPLRLDAARASDALADLAEAGLAHEPSSIAARTASARDAVANLRRRFLATPHRPTGPTGPAAALASLVDELDWLLSFLAPSTEMPRLALCREENAEAMAATVAVLRTSAARLDGRDERPDLDRLDDAREALAQALARRIPELPAVPDDEALGSALEPAFRIRALSYAARQVAGYALLATGADTPELDELDVARRDTGRPARAALQATERLAVEHASARAVRFRNSPRRP